MEESGPAVLDQPTPPHLCVMEESGPAVLDQPTPPHLCVMEESGPAVLDQPPPHLCVMEESGPAVLNQPPPLLCLLLLCSSSRGNKENSTIKETSSCSLAALVVETVQFLPFYVCAPHVVSHVTCTCSFVCLLLLLRCVHSVSACHDQSVLPYASW